MQHSVDVIILTYKPGKQIFELIDSLEKQSYPIHKIILMNTEEKYFEKRFYGTRFLEKYKNIEVHHLSSKEFDHGRTRRRAVEYSNADIFICMTQDAIPANDKLVENLVHAITSQDQVVAAYARQLPYEDCREIERFTRSFNYPEESSVKSIADLDRLGIKTFFCSNVCAAYHRNMYDRLGGFVKKTIFNEDMIFAGKAIKAGEKIAYVADACVYHSHNYTCMQQLKRNFDLGVSQAQHPEIFKDVPSESEGIKMVKKTITHLKEKKLWYLIPYLIASSGCKYLGYQLGIHYKSLPYGIIIKCTNQKSYWD